MYHIFGHIVAVVLRMHIPQERLLNLTTMGALGYHQNHGWLQVRITYILSRKSLGANFNAIACKADVSGVLGVKDSMIAHILGKNSSNPCPNTSEDAWKAARQLRRTHRQQAYSDLDFEV
jgi:hypothetical protein